MHRTRTATDNLAVSCQTASQTRQGRRQAKRDADVRTLAVGYASGFTLAPHTHDWHQLIFASPGIMNVATAAGLWVVPPQRAVFVPAGIAHSVRMSGAVSMRTLYLSPDLSSALPATPQVLDVSSLLRELVLHGVALGTLTRTVAREAHVISVIVDQLIERSLAPLHLPYPKDRRAKRLAHTLEQAPFDTRSLPHSPARAGRVSVRLSDGFARRRE